MPSAATPQTPQYRITLFYGPEPVERDPAQVACVFNVKKRSWRTGVQVSVQVSHQQLARATEAAEIDAWLRNTLQSVAADERPDYESRARDLFTQALCALKLDLAIEAGLQAENRTLTGQELVKELDDALSTRVADLRARMLTELDLID